MARALDRPVLHCVLVSALHGLMYGYNSGVIGGLQVPVVLQAFNGSFVVPGSEAGGTWNCSVRPVSPPMKHATLATLEGVFTADFLAGNLLGAFTGPMVADKWGRKWGIVLGALIATVCPILMGIFPSFWLQVVIRAILGIPLGFACTIAPLYVTEVAPPAKRGSLGSMLQVGICAAIVVGMLVNFAFNPHELECLPEWIWRLQFGLGAVPGGVLLVYGIFFLPESPPWAEKNQKRKSGHAALGEPLADHPSDAMLAGKEVPQTSIADEEQSGGWSHLFSRRGCKWLIIVVGLPLCQQLTGINAIIFYGPTIIKNSGFVRGERSKREMTRPFCRVQGTYFLLCAALQPCSYVQILLLSLFLQGSAPSLSSSTSSLSACGTSSACSSASSSSTASAAAPSC